MADADLWPPKPFDIALAKFTEHNAWWTGDTGRLATIYTEGSTATHTHNGTPHKGGLVGAIRSMFWGKPVPKGEKRTRVHAPLAAQICTLSADLLFSEPPVIRFVVEPESDAARPGKGERAYPQEHPQQKRLDEIMGSDETHAELLKAGELAAALGGVYLGVVWDADVADRVWLQAYAADCAIPVFKHGRLVECTLWSEFRPEGNEVFRLLEKQTRGLITYSLWRGTEKTLGKQVPLGTLPDTAHYEWLRSEAELQLAPEERTLSVSVATGIPGLAVEYVPNMLPQREWRKEGQLAYLGRSDLSGIEELLDKYDETWTSLVRDLELGRGRITVPESALEHGDRGEGATFDPDREVYVGLNALGRSDQPIEITATQFDIRVQEHLDTLDAIKREIANTLGYSEAHLGIRDAATGARTATEITADFSDSERTRDKKAMHVKPALARIARAALGIDAKIFPNAGGAWVEELPEIEFSPVSQQDMEKAARIVQTAYASAAMSLRERVRTLHPEWDDEQVDDEVEALQAELGGLVPDPAEFTGDPNTVNGEREAAGDDQHQGEGTEAEATPPAGG